MTTHRMFDGRVQLFKRGRVWWCAASVGGERFRDTTKEEDLDRAKDVAEEWYLDLRGKLRRGEVIQKEHTFGEAADLYMRDAKVLATHVRSPKYIEYMDLRMKVHIIPFFGDKRLTYAQVVALAFNPPPPDATGFTIAFRKGPRKDPKGTLAEGESVAVKDGMIFVVTPTNRS